MARRSFQTGSVHTRKTERGTVHVIRYRQKTADGKWRHRAETINSPRKKDAEAVLAERLREVNGGALVPSEKTFAEFASTHWKSYVEQKLKPSTQASHGSALKTHLLPAFGGFRLREISALAVSTFFDEKRKSGLSPKSLLNLYLLLQKMLNLAIDLELIPVSPLRRVHRPRVEHTEKPALTPIQIRSIIEKAPDQHKALLILLYLTGLRIGEALALKWQDVDFERSVLYVRRAIWHGREQSPKSRRSIRAKHMLPGMRAALQVHRSMSAFTAPEDYVFPNGAGKPHNPDDLRKRMLYPAMDAAGINRTTARAFGFHLFRHSAGSQMQQATGDLAQTQRFLGHGSIAITNDTYVHLQPDAEVKAMEKLEAAIFPKAEAIEKAEKEIPPELYSIVLKRGFSTPREQMD